MSSSSLKRLSELCGIEPEYFDIWGRRHETTVETERRLLSTMKFDLSSDTAIEHELERLQAHERERLLPPVIVVKESEPIAIPITSEGRFTWRIREETGREHTGEATAKVGDRTLLLAVKPPTGYHDLLLDDGRAQGEARLIVTPLRCYLPPVLESEGRRLWGLAIQLYALRSERNWGIGDFGDLQTLVQLASTLGASFIGLNPLHALFPNDTSLLSPYSPSSRQGLNVLYLDILSIEDFRESEAVQHLASSLMLQEKLEGIREPEFVDYETVNRVKFRLFEELFRHFQLAHLQKSTLRARAFRTFVEQSGEDLRNLAVYDALDEHFRSQHSALWGWPVWPEQYRNPQSEAVRRFEDTHRERVEFYQYLQWQSELQLARAAAAAESQGMAIGFYADIALGVNGSGAEAWANQDLYAFGASCGAPPDLLNVKGQVWGLPPLIPFKLRERAYEPLIRALRYSMRFAGALRIDHIMGLMRVFWVPEGGSGKDGAYVRYFLDDLMGIVALESQRNHCLVIGEDLGTVPEEVRAAMHDRRVLSYKVLYFMNDEGGKMLPLSLYPERALVTATTHDLPTLAGFWRGEDLEVRRHLNLFSEYVTYEGEKKRRTSDIENLLQRLKEEHLLPDNYPVTEAVRQRELKTALCAAIHLFLGRSKCQLQSVGLDDLLRQTGQMNLPGTTKEHPNWKRRLALGLEELSFDPFLREFARELNAARRHNAEASPNLNLLP